MLTAFPTPVLSIAADAVKDLEGRDALSGLWTLFTKCKESLQDGRRLENISWRLWYCEMMRDDLSNRLYQEKLNEKEDQEDHALTPQPQEVHTPIDLYRPPTPSESTFAPPTYAIQDANELLNDSNLNYRPPLISATSVLPQDHDHTTSSPTFSSSRLGPTQVIMFRSNSPADPAPCPPLDLASASLQMSKSKLNSDTVLSPVVPVHPFSLSLSSSSGSKSRDVADVPPHVHASSVQSTLSGFQAHSKCHTRSNLPVGRIIYDMLPCSASNGSEVSRSGVNMWPPSMTTTMTRKSTSAECIPTPVAPLPALMPTTLAGLPNSIEHAGSPTHATISSTPSSSTNSRYTSLHAAPPSPSLSDSYASAHPGEVEVSDTTRLDVGVSLGPSLSVSASSPSSPQMLGSAHIFGLSPNPQLPPRLVVVNPTPNLTPHPTPPASPHPASVFAPASSASASTSGTGTGSNNHNGFGGMKGNWLTLPPNHYHHRVQDPRQDQNHDRSRSDYVATTAVTTTDINFVSSSSFLPLQPPQPPSHHQNADEDQLASSQSFVQEMEISTNSNSNRHSISSITTITSMTTDCTTSTAISAATAATSAFLDEASEVEEPKKMAQDDDMWIDDGVVVGSPVDHVDVDAQPMGLRLDSLSTIHSMSVGKGGGDVDDSAALSDEDSDVEELADGGSTYFINATTTGAAASTKKKKTGVKKKIKTKTKPLKRNSLRSPTSTVSQPPPPPPALHQSTSSSSTKQKQRTVAPAPPIARCGSNGRSSSRSVSRSGGSSVGVGAGVRTNSSVSRSRSREIRGAPLGMTRAASGDRKKPVIAVSTKLKNRPKFMLGSKGRGSSGKIVGGSGGSTIIRRESSGGSGAGAEENGNDEKEREKERERGRERMIAMEMIQMQRRQQLLIQQQQQQQLEIKQREDEQRALTVQLARQDADVHEIRKQRQRLRHEQQQGRGVQGGANELLGVSSKRPVAFNIGSHSDEGSGMGSNSKSGSEFSGIEQMIPPVGPIVNGKGKERDVRDVAGILGQEIQQEGVSRQPHQLGIVQQQQTVAPHHHHHHHHPASRPHPTPLQQLKSEQQLERQIIQEGEQVAERQLHKEEKGKRRAHSDPNTHSKLSRTASKANINDDRPPPPADNTNTKHSTHETLNMVSSALAAKVKHTLADPLLPGQHKRTIVLTTSESEFEDSDDDGSWSSEEMGTEDEQEGQRVDQQRQDQLLAQQYQQQQQQQQQQRQLQQQQQLQHRPPPLQRAHTTNLHTANHNHNHTHGANRTQRTQSSRGHRHPSNHAQGQALMTQAVQEAQRQRDMFAKKPTESFQNLTQVARTQSVGLLTQLMNPNPEIFPVGHPYRRGYSSSEIRGGGIGDRDRDRGFRLPQPLTDVKATKTDIAQDDKLHERPPPSRPEAKHRKSSSPSVHPRATAAMSPPVRTLSMQLTKSTAAMPVSSQVQAGSVSTRTSNAVIGGPGAVNGFGMTNMKMTVNSNHSSGGYRPKGPPQDQELEDESGSEGESGSGIQVSKSVAQEKLKALAERRGIIAYGNQPTTTANGGSTNQKTQLGDEVDVPEWAKVSQPRPPPTRTRSHDQYPQSQAPDHNANRRSLNAFHFGQMITSTANHPTPIPVGHPYNLPPPAPPSTPRTTRRLMLSTELSESLRRNLLWERQVSKVNLAAAVRRTASSGGGRHSLLGGVQPLTTAPNMVQLLPKGTMAHPNPGSPMRPEQGGGGGVKERRASGGAGNGPGPSVYDEDEKEKRRRLAMARNRSWANDYHFAGW